ncbi:MAG: aldo/keto reductase [Calditrichia bacterium]
MSQQLGLGTAAIGRPQYINIREQEQQPFQMNTFKEKGRSVLEAAYQQGIRYFDTAPGYGLAEKLLLEWLLEKQDASIEVASKWGYTYTANFEKNASVHELKEHSLAKLNEQWEFTRKLLPFLTTYQIHSATFDTGVLENKAVLERLAELKEQFELHIGLTTSGANQTDVIQKAMTIELNDKPLFTAYQVTCNIFEQSLFEIYRDLTSLGVRVIIKEAMANGRVFPNTHYPDYKTTYEILNEIAEKYGVGVDAVALRFCMDSLKPFKVLSGVSETTHLIDNHKSCTFALTEDELASLKQLKVSSQYYWAERKLLPWR